MQALSADMLCKVVNSLHLLYYTNNKCHNNVNNNIDVIIKQIMCIAYLVIILTTSQADLWVNRL